MIKKYLKFILPASILSVIVIIFVIISLNQSPAPIAEVPIVSTTPDGQKYIDTSEVEKLNPVKSEPSKVAKSREEMAESTFKDNGRDFPLIEYRPLAVPNDTYAVQEWTNDTNLQPAWDNGAGASPTKLAIIDSGFSLGHQEFSNRWLENSGEKGAVGSEQPSVLNCTDQAIPVDAACNLIDDDFDEIVDNEVGEVGIENPSRLNCTDQALPLDKSCNLIDDESNGFVDDVTGWDFINYDRSSEAGETSPLGESTGHGTMVTGVAAATGNNGVGIAGVNWSSKILPLQAIDDDGYGNTLSLSRAIYYAIDQEVDVISLSLGTATYDAYLRTAIDTAIDNDIVIVAATGNDYCNCINYPANFPEVVAVGAVDINGNAASFSNWGSNLDIMAPGTGIRTPTWVDGSNSSYVNSVSGTSFATPIVGGLLALLKSHQPDASWGEIIGTITQNAYKTKLTGVTQRSTTYGYGNLNAGSASTAAITVRSEKQETRLGPQLVEDILGTERLITCPSNLRGGTPIFELKKNNAYKYTDSELTNYSYTLSGWTSKLVGYGCVSLPTDTPESIRNINLVSELNNLSPKFGY